MLETEIKNLIKNPWVQCPQIKSVQQLLKTVEVTNYARGSGKARHRLDYLESIYRDWVKDIVDLSEFNYCYFVNGVTDAINQWMATEHRTWQFLEGDYEYAHMISGSGEKVKYYNNIDVLYVSNPSCATGDFIKLKDIPNPIILDCAYIGSTLKQKIFVPKTTEQIWFSFSKGWGLVGQRAGLVFTKTPHKSLDVMKNVEGWNYTSVETAIAIVENYAVDTVASAYKPVQQRLCEQYNFTPSDCFFIAKTEDKRFRLRRRQGNVARLDLSSLMENVDA